MLHKYSIVQNFKRPMKATETASGVSVRIKAGAKSSKKGINKKNQNNFSDIFTVFVSYSKPSYYTHK